MKKVVVLGNTGMLGRYVYQHLSKNSNFKVIGINRSKLDAETVLDHKPIYNLLYRELQLKEEDTVINCIGIIKQKTRTLNSDFIKVNSLFPQVVSNTCSVKNINFIHISTDCIFSGRKGKYIETDIPDPVDIYGKSKYLGEPDYGLIIRTSIIGEEVKNKLSFLEWAKSNRGNTVQGYTNHYWNGVTTLQLAKYIEHIITLNLVENKIFHYHTAGDVHSKYTILSLINYVYDLDLNIIKEKKDPIDRSLNSIYNEEACYVSYMDQLKELKHFHLREYKDEK